MKALFLAILLCVSAAAQDLNILITYKDHPTEETRTAVRKTVNATLVREADSVFTSMDVIHVPPQRRKAAIKKLERNQAVQFAEEDAIYHAAHK
jgi:hypothetical protein